MLLVARMGRPTSPRNLGDVGGLGWENRYLWVGLSRGEVVRALALMSRLSRGDPLILLRYRGRWRIEAIGKIRLILRSPEFSSKIKGISFRAFEELTWMGEEVLEEKTRDLIESMIGELGWSPVWQLIHRGEGVVILAEVEISCDKEAPDYMISSLPEGVKYPWGLLAMY